MRLSEPQYQVLVKIYNTPGQELEACFIHPVTREALVRKKLVEECARLYFGPRSLRYRLSAKGKSEMEKRWRTAGKT